MMFGALKPNNLFAYSAYMHSKKCFWIVFAAISNANDEHQTGSTQQRTNMKKNERINARTHAHKHQRIDAAVRRNSMERKILKWFSLPFQICFISSGFIDKPVLIGRMAYELTAQSNATPFKIR